MADAPANSPRKRHALELFPGLPAHYDSMGAALSFGQDPRWRRELVRAIDPRPGDRVLDVATGTGMVAEALARRSACTIVALDQSDAMLARAEERLRRAPALASQITLVRGEAERLPFADATFDALTFTYLLRYLDDRLETMRELARVVKPGGRMGMVEFGVPRAAALRALWRVQTRVACPCSAGSCPRRGSRSGASSVRSPNIEQFHALELFGGRFHTDVWLALAWGGFPAFTGYFAQTLTIRPAGVLVAAGCCVLSAAQRRLSTPVRELRRRTTAVSGEQRLSDGTAISLTKARLAAPLEGALSALSLAVVLLAAGLVAVQLGPRPTGTGSCPSGSTARPRSPPSARTKRASLGRTSWRRRAPVIQLRYVVE